MNTRGYSKSMTKLLNLGTVSTGLKSLIWIGNQKYKNQTFWETSVKANSISDFSIFDVN